MRFRFLLLAFVSSATAALTAGPALAAGRALAAGPALAAGTAGTAGTAVAATSASSNWAGYAAHGNGVRFTRVIGAWTQPSATCVAGHATYSAIWIGLGGYSAHARALEQIGTEVDCTASGTTSSSAWMELVPAASKTLSMAVSPGDTIAASVTVKGHRATVALYDATNKQSFKRTLTARSIDVSSAEWIVEAPSDCTSATVCQTLPLANFGTVQIALARAVSTTGHTGAITDSRWLTTAIQLTPASGHAASRAAGATTGGATPSSLGATGSSFSVAYSDVLAASRPFYAVPNLARLLHRA